jgi:hypothetical protein
MLENRLPENPYDQERERIASGPIGARRLRWIDAFKARNRQTRDWIAWEWIAEHCARENQLDIVPSRQKRVQAYAELVSALETGEFDDAAGTTRVLFLCPSDRLKHITREDFEFVSGLFSPDILTSQNLRHFWITNDAAVAWFRLRQRPLPHWLEHLREPHIGATEAPAPAVALQSPPAGVRRRKPTP